VPVVVMLCFARSGGTVLNQCLGSLPNVLMLSEVNPLGGGWGREGENSYTTVKTQAKQWYQIDLTAEHFGSAVLELGDICKDRSLDLVVRDWSFVNFVPCSDNGWNPPNRFLTLEALEDKCRVIPFAFVRNAIDVWLSRGGPMEAFFGYYLRYVKSIVKRGITVFKYEDFCEEPGTAIRRICGFTGLKYSESYKNYAAFNKVNGDVQNPFVSRGGRLGEIRRLPRRDLAGDRIAELNRNADMIEANSLMGYPDSYQEVPACGYPRERKCMGGCLDRIGRLFGSLNRRIK
jgi:hypothetical protein